MNFFGVGPAEAGLVFVIALIVVGPQRFPEIMRTAGRYYRIARAYSNEVMKDVRSAVDEIEREVKAETDDLKSLGSMDTGLAADLKEAREAMEDVGKDTKAAAAGPATPLTPPSDTSITAPPSSGSSSAPSREPAGSVADASKDGSS